jgi:hypothetical protein
VIDRRSSLPYRGKEGIFLFATASTRVLGPTQPHIEWVPGTPSLQVKRPGREADISSPSNAVRPLTLNEFLALFLIKVGIRLNGVVIT